MPEKDREKQLLINDDIKKTRDHKKKSELRHRVKRGVQPSTAN